MRHAAASMRAAALCGLGLIAGCSFDPENPARGCDDCPGTCYLGYCLLNASGVAGNPGVAGGNASAGTSAAGSSAAGSAAPVPCAGDAEQPCYEGPAGTQDQGACRGGTAACENGARAACDGQILPKAETCNAIDDDCDGKVDEEIAAGSCTNQEQGTCAQGTLRCEQGVEVCRSEVDPIREVCNGVDDDCDGEIDNGTTVACYPDGTAGCTRNADGSFDCDGLCQTGVQRCENGQPTECTGMVTPVAEVCGGAQARDENCNGQVDDTCPCTNDATQECYDGAEGTAGRGTCQAGTQQCVNGAWGPCTGSRGPEPETCANQSEDNDCDGTRDNVEGINASCTDNSQLGLCRRGVYGCRSGVLDCITRAPSAEVCDLFFRDEDCDGQVNEGFDLATDERNCGLCGWSCATGQLCCAGVCINPTNDAANCNTCGNNCGSGRLCCNRQCTTPNTAAHCGTCEGCGTGLSCCSRECLRTNTNTNCGGCGVTCDTAGGEACCNGSCADTASDTTCGASCANCAAMGKKCCGGTCASITADDTCGASCTDCAAMGKKCCAGSCHLATDPECNGCPQGCEADETCCNGQCVNTDEDPAHCGGCNAPNCAGACCDGQCVNTDDDEAHCGGCDAPNCAGTCCGGQCVADTGSDDEHCGASCIDCAAMGRKCCGGVCHLPAAAQCNGCPQGCPDGETCCEGQCVNTDTNGPNCGGCNMPGCAEGETCCGGQCVNTDDSELHCNGCNKPCDTAPCLMCVDGVCINPDPEGPQCQ